MVRFGIKEKLRSKSPRWRVHSLFQISNQIKSVSNSDKVSTSLSNLGLVVSGVTMHCSKAISPHESLLLSPFHTLTPHSCGSRRGPSTFVSCLRLPAGWSAQNTRDQSCTVVYTQQDKTDKHMLHQNPRQTEPATLVHHQLHSLFGLKGTVQSKVKIASLFTRPHVVPNPCVLKNLYTAVSYKNIVHGHQLWKKWLQKTELWATLQVKTDVICSTDEEEWMNDWTDLYLSLFVT